MEKNFKPVITIGITCYQEGDWLKECWDSVLAQTDSRWEAIMILDGDSDEKTRDIFKRIEHPRLRKFELKANVKQYLTRTLAIINSKTDWYAHLDGDDQLPANAVALIIDAIQENLDARFIFGDCVIYNDETLNRSIFRELKPNENDLDTICLRIARTSPIKKDLFFEVGGFAPQLLTGAADLDFWISVAEKKIPWSRADGIIYEIRNRKGSVSQTRNITFEEIYNTIYSRHPGFFAKSKAGQLYIIKAFLKVANQFKTEGNHQKSIFYQKKAKELINKYDLEDEILGVQGKGFIHKIINRFLKIKFVGSCYEVIKRKYKNFRKWSIRKAN